MARVLDHYEHHLAPVYAWMSGGVGPALERGRIEVAELCPRPTGKQLAVDLGAGFGLHSIALADLGYSVLAIDSSRILLEELRANAGSRPIKTSEGDLLDFRPHIEGLASLVLCMGDTLTHLEDLGAVETLFSEVASSLIDGGKFIATFRDYSVALQGAQRFIPVRSDAERILTCFLEYEDETVNVHDILHERIETGWQQRVSTYRKLRLSVDWVISALNARGFHVRQDPGLAGMIRVNAERKARASIAQPR